MVLPILAAGCFVFSVVHVVRAQKPRMHPAPLAATVGVPISGDRIAATGIVEPSSENIHVGSHRPGIVTVVNVRAQDVVQAGATVFCLDDRAATAELHAREADLTMARAQLDRLARMPRAEELPPLAARVGQERARLEDLDDQLRRTTNLVSGGALPSEQAVRIRQQREEAASALQAAQAELDLKRAGAWAPDRGVAQAAVDQATANAERARTEVDLLCAKAPVASTVLRVDVHVGEFVSTTTPQDLVTLGVVEPLHVRVDVDEPDIPRFAPESGAQALPRGGGDAVPLRFVRAEPLVQPKRWLSGATTERVDTRVLQVLYAVDGHRPTTKLFVGQQLDVFVEAGRSEAP
jgi:multidrug efflux pump subunit AcrA (membrane-fusion protein)